MPDILGQSQSNTTSDPAAGGPPAEPLPAVPVPADVGVIPPEPAPENLIVPQETPPPSTPHSGSKKAASRKTIIGLVIVFLLVSTGLGFVFVNQQNSLNDIRNRAVTPTPGLYPGGSKVLQKPALNRGCADSDYTYVAAQNICILTKLQCGSVTINPQVDRNNCGACGMGCSGGALCANGTCTTNEVGCTPRGSIPITGPCCGNAPDIMPDGTCGNNDVCTPLGSVPVAGKACCVNAPIIAANGTCSTSATCPPVGYTPVTDSYTCVALQGGTFYGCEGRKYCKLGTAPNGVTTCPASTKPTCTNGKTPICIGSSSGTFSWTCDIPDANTTPTDGRQCVAGARRCCGGDVGNESQVCNANGYWQTGGGLNCAAAPGTGEINPVEANCATRPRDPSKAIGACPTGYVWNSTTSKCISNSLNLTCGAGSGRNLSGTQGNTGNSVSSDTVAQMNALCSARGGRLEASGFTCSQATTGGCNTNGSYLSLINGGYSIPGGSCGSGQIDFGCRDATGSWLCTVGFVSYTAATSCGGGGGGGSYSYSQSNYQSNSPTPTTPTVIPQCNSIKIYKNGAVVTPSTLQPGDAIVIAVAGGNATKARIRVNGGSWTETTTKNGAGEYTMNYVIPTGPTRFRIESEIFGVDNQWH